VLIWLLEGTPGRLSRRVIERVEAAAARGRVMVAAISAWEVALLEQRRRIKLSRPIEDWVQAALRQPGIQLVGLSPEIAIDSSRLPDLDHNDPVDCMLIATARVTGSHLVTCDARIVDYGEARHVNVLDARR
jgi:PIN domain nuclease of toxin-antitoxin system